MKRSIATTLVLVGAMAGCATPMPPGREDQRTFVQESGLPYQDAYRVIAKQMRACYRTIGVFGNGYDVQADLDAGAKQGVVELYPVGLTGAQKVEDSKFGLRVKAEATPAGTRITSTGTTPSFVFQLDGAIRVWLSGMDSCSA